MEPNGGGNRVLVYAESLMAAVKQQAEAGAALRADISRLSAANSALKSECDALCSELEAVKARSAQLEADNKALCTDVAALNQKNATLRDENCSMREELDRLKRQEAANNAQGSDIGGLQAANRRLRSIVETTSAQLQAAKVDLKAEAVAAREKLAAAEAQNAQLRSQQEQFRVAIKNLQRRASGSDRAPGCVDKQRLIAFLERSFACTGDTELLRSALSEFCDDEAARNGSGASADTPRDGSQFVPKPLLLIHRISASEVGLGSTPIDATPASTSLPASRKRSGESGGVTDDTSSVADSTHEEQKEEERGDGDASSTPASTPAQDVIDLTEENAPLVAASTAVSTASDAESGAQRGQGDEEGANDRGSDGQSGTSADLPSRQTPARTAAKRGRHEVSSERRLPRTQSVAISRLDQVNEGARKSSRRSSESPRLTKKRTAPTVDAAPSISCMPSSVCASTSITEADVRRLCESKPWEAMFEKRPLFSHVLNHQSLSTDAKNWVNRALAFRYHFCQELWEQRHWLFVPIGARSKELDKLMDERVKRHVRAQSAWNELRATADALIRADKLSPDVWLDPFLWLPPRSPLTWAPKSRDLVQELATIDAAQPERCFYVNDMARHPFYTTKLSDKHPEKHPLTHT